MDKEALLAGYLCKQAKKKPVEETEFTPEELEAILNSMQRGGPAGPWSGTFFDFNDSVTDQEKADFHSFMADLEKDASYADRLSKYLKKTDKEQMSRLKSYLSRKVNKPKNKPKRKLEPGEYGYRGTELSQKQALDNRLPDEMYFPGDDTAEPGLFIVDANVKLDPKQIAELGKRIGTGAIDASVSAGKQMASELTDKAKDIYQEHKTPIITGGLGVGALTLAALMGGGYLGARSVAKERRQDEEHEEMYAKHEKEHPASPDLKVV
jgi:hypothetical protein